MASNDIGKSNKFVAIAAVIGVCVVVALFAASLWQENTKESKIGEAESGLPLRPSSARRRLMAPPPAFFSTST